MNQATNGSRTAILAGATAVGVLFCAWSITSALYVPPKAVAAPAQPAAVTAENGSSNAAQDSERQRWFEAQLAPNADPFTPAPVRAAVHTSGGGTPVRTASANGTFPSPPGTGRSGSWPPFSTGPLPPVGLTPDTALRPATSVPHATAEPPPLIGTMLGQRPAAVFRIDNAVTIVPVGEKVRGWRVLQVAPGQAVVKSPAGRRTLAVGGSGVAPTAGAGAATAPAAPRSETSSAGE